MKSFFKAYSSSHKNCKVSILSLNQTFLRFDEILLELSFKACPEFTNHILNYQEYSEVPINIVSKEPYIFIYSEYLINSPELQSLLHQLCFHSLETTHFLSLLESIDNHWN